jgi:hypothetical protein
LLLLPLLLFVDFTAAQTARSAKAELGSATARNGFKNEAEIAAKFNNWQADADARVWLAAMNFRPENIKSVSAMRPSGEKADVEITVVTDSGISVQGISIKLVSGAAGFNQIDKRWLSHYAKMWNMPPEVRHALELFLGEAAPTKPGRSAERMYLNELDEGSRKSIVDFFAAHKDEIVSDLFMGDGKFHADWIMVAQKNTETPRWVIRSVADVMKYFGEGNVAVTARGNLRIGRITMQRKGGDAGRDTAKMLQFKIDPALLFEMK